VFHFTNIRHLADERGTAMIEFAIVLPLLLLLVLGILDFAKALNYWNDENQLAGVGARYAAVDNDPGPGKLSDWIQQQADTGELRRGGSSASKVSVCISFPAGGAMTVGSPVKVEVKTHYSFLPYLVRSGVGSRDLVSSATMRLERAPTTYGAECSTP
jgi:Flp pilus assembly pilin Flp